MSKISQSALLEGQIEALKIERNYSLQDLKEHISFGVDQLRPVNIIKSTFDNVVSETNLPQDMVGNALGVGAGFLAKKVFSSYKKGLFGTVGGLVLQYFVTKKVANNSDSLKSLAIGIINKFKNRKNSGNIE